jgi:hypothetical protein
MMVNVQLHSFIECIDGLPRAARVLAIEVHGAEIITAVKLI